MRKRRLLLPVSFSLALACCASRSTTVRHTLIDEASGVARRGDHLLIVDDSIPGSWFRVPLPTGSPKLFPLNGPGVQQVPFAEAKLAMDLESVEVLADGRVVCLSERLRCLVGDGGLITEYDYPLSEFGRRGLEGLSVRPLPGGTSRVAVLWEGGYPDFPSLPFHLQIEKSRIPLRPVIFIHDLSPRQSGLRLKLHQGVQWFFLQVPVPDGREPLAQRLRTPDMVWYRFPDQGGDTWGFIVLLSSQNSTDQPEYLYHWLQRYTLDGKPYGGYIDLDKLVGPPHRGANWEGLTWFEEGKSVVLVHEGGEQLPPHAMVLDLPPDWRYSR